MDPTLLNDLKDRAALLVDRARNLRDLLANSGAPPNLTEDQADAALLVLGAALVLVESVYRQVGSGGAAGGSTQGRG